MTDELHFHMDEGIVWNGSTKRVRLVVTRWQADKGTPITEALISPGAGYELTHLYPQLAPGAYIVTLTSPRKHKIKASTIIRLRKTRRGISVETVGS